MNKIIVKIDDMIEELEKMKSSGNEYVTLTIEEAEPYEGIPAHIMLDDSGCVIQYWWAEDEKGIDERKATK